MKSRRPEKLQVLKNVVPGEGREIGAFVEIHEKSPHAAWPDNLAIFLLFSDPKGVRTDKYESPRFAFGSEEGDTFLNL